MGEDELEAVKRLQRAWVEADAAERAAREEYFAFVRARWGAPDLRA